MQSFVRCVTHTRACALHQVCSRTQNHEGGDQTLAFRQSVVLCVRPPPGRGLRQSPIVPDGSVLAYPTIGESLYIMLANND